MPIFEEVEEQPVPPEVSPVRVKAYAETYRGIAVDTSYAPKSSMLAWINGSNWNVTYFAQVLDHSQEPTPLALHRAPPYQQYYRINKINLKVNTPITKSANDEIRTFAVTGSGHTYPALVPNYGDMFVADVGDGRLGLFTITSANRETYLRDSTYAVEWKMVGWLTPEQMSDLEAKTQITYYWSAAKLACGCNPYVTEQEQQDGIDFEAMRKKIIKQYVSDFFSSAQSTFIVPDQLTKVYDHFTVKAVMAMIDTISDNRMWRVKALNVQSEPVMKQPTVWDAILYQDESRVCVGSERAQLVSTKISRWRPELQAIGYSGLPRFVFPMDAPTDVDAQYSGRNRFIPDGIPFQEGQPRRPLPGPYKSQAQRDLAYFKRIAPENAKGVDPAMLPPDIKPVAGDEYYIFSQAFYYQDTKLMSKLEMLTWQMIRGEEVNKAQLRTIIKCCLDWDNLERYYFHPVLMALLKYANRS